MRLNEEEALMVLRVWMHPNLELVLVIIICQVEVWPGEEGRGLHLASTDILQSKIIRLNCIGYST